VTALEAAGIRHITMPVHRKRLSALFQIAPFRRLLEEERPDILHLRSRLPAWIAWLAWRRLDARNRPGLVCTVHGFYSVNAYSAVMTRGERLIAVSESVHDYTLKNYPGVPAQQVRIIPRGIDPAEYPRGYQPDSSWLRAWLAEYPALAGRRLLTLPGRVTRLKGHEDFLHVLARLIAAGQQVHGLIAGETPPGRLTHQRRLTALARRLGVAERVTFTGHRAELREILAISDVVCSVSRRPESFGRTTLEALALGRPVVGYEHGGVGEQLRALFPCGAVTPGNVEGAVEVVLNLLNNPRTPAPVGLPFTLEAMCRATLEVYEELLISKHRLSW
jgi:glycosyltransferase involved in cell wall biosynthesis